ncbi:hypothetical protein E1B28_007779 [Marasmius oreades]|uniref:Uncharacterized protein n=1 Tax=Marasmius oreades TaxID=181124 RepID=A0A9P7S2F0_9AGAR|nr:uncharacterized protein E1B28_007779 [Marasmius oreades]KAG7094169.1 hypothetical protein E1B28_007779 [Marasmius oreades]
MPVYLVADELAPVSTGVRIPPSDELHRGRRRGGGIKARFTNLATFEDEVSATAEPQTCPTTHKSSTTFRTIFAASFPFSNRQLGTDRRLIVNRERQLMMY